MFSSLLGFALLSLSLPYVTLASLHGSVSHRRHEAIAAAQHNVTENVTEVAEHTLERRGYQFQGARLTYYSVGLGACGQYNKPSDYIVALNSGMYGGGYPGPNCFRPIEINYKGKTVQATIMDECPGCPSDGGLDLSEGLFGALASLDDGVIYANWRFLDDGSSGGNNDPPPETTTTSQKPKPTTSQKPQPTTTWQEPSTTSTWQEPTTTSTKKHSTTTTSSSTTPSTTSTTSSSSSTFSSTERSTTSTTWTPTSTSTSTTAAATPTGPDTLGKLNQAFVGLAEVMLAGAQAA